MQNCAESLKLNKTEKLNLNFKDASQNVKQV